MVKTAESSVPPTVLNIIWEVMIVGKVMLCHTTVANSLISLPIYKVKRERFKNREFA